MRKFYRERNSFAVRETFWREKESFAMREKALPWERKFCRERESFAVTPVGHRSEVYPNQDI